MGSLEFRVKKHCYICRSGKTTKNYKGSENWYHTYGKDKPMCGRCYARVIQAPKYAARHPDKIRLRNAKYNKLGITFAGHGKLMSFRQLTGFCSKCSKNIHDGTCKITQMHHRFYIIIMPWFGRQELCVSCHNKTKQRDVYGRILKQI